MSKRALVVYRELKETAPYAAALEAVDVTPVLVRAGDSVSLDGCLGVLLMGGGDVNPKRYGEAAHPLTETPDDELDDAESALLGETLERDLPVLAICRGLQILNVHQGGTLIQHLESTSRHRVRTPDRGAPAHEVAIEPGTLLASVAGTDRWHVNSRHHQAVGRLGQGLRVSARDIDDGTIEAIEHTGRRFVLGVQWHPENQAVINPEQKKLFSAFAAALS